VKVLYLVSLGKLYYVSTEQYTSIKLSQLACAAHIRAFHVFPYTRELKSVFKSQ